MSSLTSETVKAALARVTDPASGRDVVSAGLISGVTVRDGKVGFLITIDPKDKHRMEALASACETAAKALPGVASVTAVLTAHNAEPIAPGSSGYTQPRERAHWNLTPLEHVKSVIAVASGKGGVGKSTTAVNLALALRDGGKRVGILDADIYGPSIPRMSSLSGQPEIKDGKMIPLMAFPQSLVKPAEPRQVGEEAAHRTGVYTLVHEDSSTDATNQLAGAVGLDKGIACMSMGFITGEEAAILRGPMISKALQQMLRMTRWGTAGEPLDVLIVDMPPGTGDIHLSMVQQVPLAGAVIVTTPQAVATIDAQKCLTMFRKVNVPVLGVVENMSGGLFGSGGGQALADANAVPFLGAIPMDAAICEAGDVGRAYAGAASAPYRAIAQRLLA